MPIYTRVQLKKDVQTMISGKIQDTDLNTIVDRAVRDVLSDTDLRSSKRKSALSPNLFDDTFDYSCPTDLKGLSLIDVKPQINRGRMDQWRLTTEEEFDRLKEDNEDSIVAISDADFVRKIKISRPIDDNSLVINPLDVVGDWAGFGDGTNITKDSDNYVKDSASLNWDISAAGGTTAGIYNASLTQFDLSDYLSTGSIFVWVYITSKTNLTNFIVRVGSSASAYYQITVTTNNEGVSFYNGWNLLRFDMINKSITGTPDDDACNYVALYMTKAAGKVSETDYRFDNLVIKRGDHYNVIYYSKYLWQSIAGTYLENSTIDTDYVNVDTEELRIIELKYAELSERFLRNHSEADRYFQLYQTVIKEYGQKYPSESMLIITTYHFI